MTIKNLIVIPVRLESTRLPGKALLEVNGKSILQHTYEQCLKSKEADMVCVVTDNLYVSDVAQFNNISTYLCPTDDLDTNRCGTERVINFLKSREPKNTPILTDAKKIVSVQVDYPEIDPVLIDKVFNTLTPVEPIVSAIYFHRKPKKDDVGCIFSTGQTLSNFKRNSEASIVHVGIYGFTQKILKLLQLIYQADKSESYDLEQTLWLDYGLNIRGLVTEPTISINNQDDLDEFSKKLEPSQDK